MGRFSQRKWGLERNRVKEDRGKRRDIYKDARKEQSAAFSKNQGVPWKLNRDTMKTQSNGTDLRCPKQVATNHTWLLSTWNVTNSNWCML